MNAKAAGLILILGIAMVLPLEADNLILSLHHHAVDNLYQNRYPESDRIISGRLSWDRTFGAVSLFADVAHARFQRNPDLSFTSLGAGADYLRTLGEKTALFFSLEAASSLYRESYADFNYGAARFTAALKSYLRPSSILKVNAQSETRSYGNNLYDHFSQSLTVSTDKFFPTQTTFKAEVGWGWKTYFHIPGAGNVPAAGSGSSGNGRGKGGPGPGIRFSQSEGRSIQIASVSALVAQGLGSRIGIRVTGTRQWTLSGGNPFVSVEEYSQFENPTFDAFSWEGTAFNAQAAFALPWDVELKIGYTGSEKSFPGIEALDLDGNEIGLIRRDSRRQFDVKIEKDVARFTFFLDYSHVSNRSNDPLFEWTGPSFSGGLLWNLSLGERN